MSCNNRYTFKPMPSAPWRIEVIGLQGVAVCWLPGSAAEALEQVYAPLWRRDRIMANEFMRGYLFGVHHSLSFGNQAPRIDVTQDGENLSFSMVVE